MLNLLAYFGGVLAHIAFKWAEWGRNATKPVEWKSYWTDHAAENIGSAISAMVFAGLWQLGIISGFLGAVIGGALGFISGGDSVAVQLPVTPGTSVLVGYVMDSMARHITRKFAGPSS